MSIYEKIKDLSNVKKISIRKLEESLGYGNGTIRRWDKQTPGIDKLQKVADYFNVSTDYLLGRTEDTTSTFYKYYNDATIETLSLIAHSDNSDFKQIIDKLPKLNDRQLKIINDLMDNFLFEK